MALDDGNFNVDSLWSSCLDAATAGRYREAALLASGVADECRRLSNFDSWYVAKIKAGPCLGLANRSPEAALRFLGGIAGKHPGQNT